MQICWQELMLILKRNLDSLRLNFSTALHKEYKGYVPMG